MHPLHQEDNPVEYKDRSNPEEPVAIVFSPSRTDSPKAQTSPDELLALPTTTLQERKESQPPVIPPKEPDRGPEKRKWVNKFIIKVIKMLNPLRTSQNRKKPRHNKTSQHRKDRSAVRERSGGGSAIFGAAAFAGAGAGAACAASCGGACGC